MSQSEQSGTLASYFDLGERDTDVGTELVGGLTTFLTMSYIIVVNPAILSNAIQIPGYSQAEVIQMIAIATALAAFAGTAVMALYARRPFGLAPGMGLNAFFAYTVVLAMGIPWQTALAAVFVEGVLFIVLTATGARRWVIEMFPEPVKYSVGAGIGAFLLFLGFQEMHVVASDEATIVTLGPIAQDPVAMLSLAGLAVTAMLYARGIRGSIIIGIVATTAVGWALTIAGVVQRGTLAPSSLPAPQYDITPLFGAFIEGLQNINPVTFTLVVFTFFFVDFFDTAGTLVGLGHQADLLDEDGNLPEIDKPLMADAVATTIGAIVGTSTTTTYIESSTGIEEGSRTGLTALVIAAGFLLALLAVPLVAAIPLYASHLALVLVGLIMLQGVTDLDWEDPAWVIAGGLTILVMPLTASIAWGIAAGLMIYPVVKTAMGEIRDVHPLQWILAGAFVVYIWVRTSGVLG